MITTTGYIDWAMRLPSHPAKVYSAPNTGEWITIHSIVGDLGAGRVPARFLSDERVPGQPDRFTDTAAASVMFILYTDGTLGQCYPITASTWTSGGREANTRSWAVEAEGGGPSNTREKLTRAAEDTFIRLVREWEAWSGKTAVPGIHIRQHKDVAKEFGYAATACASDRYSNAEARLLVEQPAPPPDPMGELNGALIKRFEIMRAALNPDLPAVEQAHKLLKGAKLI